MTFEEFLDSKYDEIDNDSNNMNKEFEARRDSWFKNLDVQEVIDYGETYGLICFLDGRIDGLNKGKQIMQGADENDILKEYKEKDI